MADIKTTEEIGLELQKRKQEKSEPVPNLRPGEVTIDDSIDEDLKKRVLEILSSGEWTNVDIHSIILPKTEDGERLAKFQFRRTRKNYDPLKRSIRDIGVISPIVLKREIGADGVERYYLLDGHTRVIILLELLEEDPTTLIPPFLVVECSDADATLIADVLNRFSEVLDDEDRPFAVIRMFELGGLSQAEIARRSSYSTSYVSEIISAFQNVPAEARELIETRKWSVKHGRYLALLKDDEKEQMRLFKLAKQHRWSTEKMEEMVKKALGRKTLVDKTQTIVEDELKDRSKKTITQKQADQIYAKTLSKVGQDFNKSWTSEGPVFRVKGAEVELSQSKVEKAITDAGFTIVASEVTPEKPKIPTMPSNEELMEERGGKYICPFCGGRTSDFIADEMNFKTDYTFVKDQFVEAHDYCQLKHEIEEAQKKLAKTTIYLGLQEDPDFLTKMNNKSHQMYKDELEKRKQQWRTDNIDPDTLIGKGVHVGEPMVKSAKTDGKPTDLELLQQVREKQPDLVEKAFFDAYENMLNGAKGWQSDRQVMKQLGTSKGTTTRRRQTIEAAIENLRE